jgi:predicted glycoside hydrolase/deacetylase ChbG (UPF0249 family)
MGGAGCFNPAFFKSFGVDGRAGVFGKGRQITGTVPLMAMRKVVLCADDYGLSPGVSRGIRDLLAAGRLSATSCMVVYPEFQVDGPLLAPLMEKADIGLHFTLTADRSIGSVLRDAYLRRLDAGTTAAELERQLAAFVSVMGTPPDYLDGHQHVHLLPSVREVIVKVAHRIGAYVRSTREPIGPAMSARPSPVESAFLSWTARPLDRLIRSSGLQSNSGFRGVRSFQEAAPYRALFRKMIAGAGNGCLVMCHPGLPDEALARRDQVTKARMDELHYFSGDDFLADLAGAGLELSRLADIARAA